MRGKKSISKKHVKGDFEMGKLNLCADCASVETPLLLEITGTQFRMILNTVLSFMSTILESSFPFCEDINVLLKPPPPTKRFCVIFRSSSTTRHHEWCRRSLAACPPLTSAS